MSARGTTNTNQRGNTRDRRARKRWLLSPAAGFGGNGVTVPCYRCEAVLTRDTLTVDRRTPAVLGGTYARPNCRPCCQTCNSVTGVELRELIKRGLVTVPGRQQVAA